MGKVAEIVLQMRSKPQNIRFADLCLVCDYYFGTARQKEAAIEYIKHHGKGDPRINIQNDKGKAKAYQVKQVLKAIAILEVDYGAEK